MEIGDLLTDCYNIGGGGNFVTPLIRVSDKKHTHVLSKNVNKMTKAVAWLIKNTDFPIVNI